MIWRIRTPKDNLFFYLTWIPNTSQRLRRSNSPERYSDWKIFFTMYKTKTNGAQSQALSFKKLETDIMKTSIALAIWSSITDLEYSMLSCKTASQSRDGRENKRRKGHMAPALLDFWQNSTPFWYVSHFFQFKNGEC